MKKKLYLTRTLKLTAFALAVVLTTYLLQSTLLRHVDNNTLRMEGFYMEERDSIDVAVIGASDVYAGYAAAYAYENFGFTSYPYATQGAPASIVTSQIREVIKYQHPQMIVVEINAFLYNDKEMTEEASARLFTDNIPDDEIRREFIMEKVDPDKRMEFFLPILKYHGSWSDYPWQLKYLRGEWELKKVGYSRFRGLKTVANEFCPTLPILNESLADDDSTRPLGVCGERNLIETLQYLRDNEIDNVVFMRFPRLVREKSYVRFQSTNTAGEIIRSYGYDFVNLERGWKEAGFETDRDFYNYEHLNLRGAEKLTDYIGRMLVDDYGVTGSSLSSETEQRWDTSVNYYHMIYNYCDAAIKKRLSEGRTGDDGLPIAEDSTNIIKKITDFARNYPDSGKYPVDTDLL